MGNHELRKEKMKTSGNVYLVRSSRPPTVEIDTSARAAYIRFSHRQVAETREVESAGCIVAIDLDDRRQVVGVELVGVSSFEIRVLLQLASVSVANPEILNRAKYIAARTANTDSEMACV